jgi:hypothetical protein
MPHPETCIIQKYTAPKYMYMYYTKTCITQFTCTFINNNHYPETCIAHKLSIIHKRASFRNIHVHHQRHACITEIHACTSQKHTPYRNMYYMYTQNHALQRYMYHPEPCTIQKCASTNSMF